MAIELYTVAYGLGIDGAGNILSGAGAPGGDASIQDSSPIGTIYIRTNAEGSSLQTYSKIATGGNSTADWVRLVTTPFLTTQLATKEDAFSKNTGFNKDFGITAGTVAEGNHTHAFSEITATPTTLAGYGITDAAGIIHTHAASDIISGTFANDRISLASVTQHQASLSILWSQITSTPTTLAGYGITDAAAIDHEHDASDITSGTFANARISQASVTQHQAALAIDWSQLVGTTPALLVTEVYTVASEAAQLALTAQEGDIAIRTDINQSFAHNGGTAGTIADWSELLSPTDGVFSFNGRTGAVTPQTGDYTFAQISSTPTDLAGYGITDAQPLDATLTALAAANWAANALPIGSGADTLTQVSFAANTFPGRSSAGNLVAKPITDFGFSLLDDADAGTAITTLGATTVGGNIFTATNPSAVSWIRVNVDNTVSFRSAVNTLIDLGLVIGTDIQAYDATLAALAAVNWSANSLAIGSGADTVAQVTFAANTFPARSSTGDLVAKPITDFIFTLLDDADATAARTTLGAAAASHTHVIADITGLQTELDDINAQLDGVGSSVVETAITTQRTVDTVLTTEFSSLEWVVDIISEADEANRKSFAIYAAHNRTSAAIATEINHTIFQVLESGAGVDNVTVAVDVSGTGSSQVANLKVTSTGAITFKATRRKYN